jgi:ribosomal protein S14
MKSIIQKDKIKRKKYLLFEINRFLLKSIIKNKNIWLSIKFNVILKLHDLSIQYTKTKINNYCIYTFRKKSLLSKFKMSRIIFLNFSRFGQISGVKKSIW